MMSIESQINIALNIAIKAHEGQVDKGGSPYIFHPLRVAAKCVEKAKIVALLHDTIEDSPLTIKDLRKEGFDNEIIEAVLLLTHDKSLSYSDYIEKVATNPIAREVKIADLSDNLDLTRLRCINDADVLRIKKYLKAYHELKSR